MSHLERALQIDVPYPCLTCGINLTEGVLYCPPCWARKQSELEARRVLRFDPSRGRRSPAVRYQITRSEEAESGNGAASPEAPVVILPTACPSGPVSGPEEALEPPVQDLHVDPQDEGQEVLP